MDYRERSELCVLHSGASGHPRRFDGTQATTSDETILAEVSLYSNSPDMFTGADASPTPDLHSAALAPLGGG